MKKIYLDYAASTPVDPNVLLAMEPYFSERFGNPGSLHAFGQEAIAAIDDAREAIARALNAEFREIIFTASATEANNLALRGSVRANSHIIVSTIEHESVLETARDLEQKGARVTCIPVDSNGIVDLEKIKESLTAETALVSVMYANNEMGTIEPIGEIAKIISAFREKNNCKTLFHVDAVQALQFLNCNVVELGVDLMTISSHKIYGPKGAGALYIKSRDRRNVRTDHLAPIITGGGQEYTFRSGTENTPAIVGFAKAVQASILVRENERERSAGLRDLLWSGVKEIVPDAELNGDSVNRLPNILNIYFPGHEAQDLLTKFDLNGLAVSSGSACRSRAVTTSHVLEALGHNKNRSRSSIRFSLGRPTSESEIIEALAIIKTAL